MAQKIRVSLDFPWPGVSNVVKYYDLPDGWEAMTEQQKDATLAEMAAEELSNAGVGSGASVVDTDNEDR